jgi:hypothetical protein
VKEYDARRDAGVLAGSLVLAAASTIAVKALTYDAWGWLLWGRELAGHLPFSTRGYPSWKPLTGLVALAVEPLGAAAPLAWLTVARLGAVLALLFAFRLARRLGGVWAGALAVAALVLMPDWLLQTGLGGSEPLLTALLLAAADRHSAGRDGAGFALALGAATLRPESWPLLAVSGIVTWRRNPGLRLAVAAGGLAVPVLWFGGDYLGSGNALHGGHLARWSKAARLARHTGEPAPLAVLIHLGSAVPFMLAAAIPVAVVDAARRRDPLLLCLAAGGLTWFVEVAALAALGYAGLTRFLFPAAAALSIVGAVGAVKAAEAARAWPLARRFALAAALIALGVPSVTAVSGLRHQASRVERRADIEQAVTRLVEREGRADPTGAGLSAEGIALTSIAWHADMSPRRLRHWDFPGVHLALRDGRWRAFWRAAALHRRRYVTRTVARRGPVYMIATVRR